MTDAEITIIDETEGAGKANVDTKSMVGAGGKTVHRQVVTLGDNVTFGNTADVNANSELLVKHTDPIPVTDNGGSLTVDGTVAISNSFATEATLAIISGNIADIETELGTKLDEATYTARQPVQGQAVMASSTPVVIASNQTAIPITDNAGSVTVDAPTATPVPMAITNTSDTLVKAGDAVNNAVRVNVVAGGAGDGAILDGVSGSIKATVHDYTNSNPLGVRLTDTNGDYVSAGAGTQYTEDVASAGDPIGGQLIARRRDALATETTTDGDNTALNSTGKGELYVKHVDAIPVTDNAGSLTVDGTVSINAIPAGTNNIGDVDVLTLPALVAGTANIGDVDVASIAAGDNNIGNVDIVTMPAVTVTGVSTLTEQQTQTTALQLIDDAIYATNGAISKTVAISGQLDDTAITDATENNCAPVRITTKRAIHTNLRNDSGTEIGTAGAPIRTDPTGSTTQPVSGTVSINAIPTGTNNIGDVDVLSLPAIPAGDNNIGNVDIVTMPNVAQSTAANLKAEVVGPTADNSANPTTKVSALVAVCNTSDPTYTNTNVNPLSVTTTGRLRCAVGDWLGSTAPTVGSKTSANSIPVVIASDQGAIPTVSTVTSVTQFNGNAIALNTGTRSAGTLRVTVATDDVVPVVGTIAHDVGDSGNPIKIGGKARTTNITSVADADRVDATFDKQGKQVVVLNAVRDLCADQTTTISASTAETTIITAIASTFNDLMLLTVANTSATATRIDFRDVSAGSVRFSLYVPAGATIGFSPVIPLKQATVNTAWTAQCGTSVTDIRIFAQYVKNV